MALVALASVAVLYLMSGAGTATSLSDSNSEVAFLEYLRIHGKNYFNNDEYQMRFLLFKDSHNKIAAHSESNGATYEMGHNRFSDMTFAEYSVVLGYKHEQHPSPEPTPLGHITDEPKEVDWRGTVAVTSVKDQGSCGSCWAFSALGSVEGRYNLMNNEVHDFAEQQLCDCDRKAILGLIGNKGCKGGLMWKAMDYLKKHGADEETQYPYISGDGSDKLACNEVPSTSYTKGHTFIMTGEYSDLRLALTEGPVAIAVNAGQECFRFYKKGILSDCAGEALDHGVVAVGYTFDDDLDTYVYFVKNSWGSRWGESGYVRVAEGNIGMILQPTVPKL